MFKHKNILRWSQLIKLRQSFWRVFLGSLASWLLVACGSQGLTTAPSVLTLASATELPGSATLTSLPAASTLEVSTLAAPVLEQVSFSKDLTPILQGSCVSCHGTEKISKGLDLKTYTNLMSGSQNGAVIVAGDAAASKLIQKIQSGSMPKRGAKLTPAQVQLFVSWVNAGALDN